MLRQAKVKTRNRLCKLANKSIEEQVGKAQESKDGNKTPKFLGKTRRRLNRLTKSTKTNWC